MSNVSKSAAALSRGVSPGSGRASPLLSELVGARWRVLAPQTKAREAASRVRPCTPLPDSKPAPNHRRTCGSIFILRGHQNKRSHNHPSSDILWPATPPC